MTSAIADIFTSFYKDLHRLTLIDSEDSPMEVFNNKERKKWERQNTPNRYVLFCGHITKTNNKIWQKTKLS